VEQELTSQHGQLVVRIQFFQQSHPQVVEEVVFLVVHHLNNLQDTLEVLEVVEEHVVLLVTAMVIHLL
jgi:hypothetical protein